MMDQNLYPYNNIEDEKGLNWRKKPYMRKINRKSNKTHKNILETLGLLGVGEKCLNFKVKMHPLIYIIQNRMNAY